MLVTFVASEDIPMASGKFVSYLRVSTDKQGVDGYGIDAQRKAVEDFLNGGRWRLLREFVEVESGKRSDRPMLAEAITHARATGATLVIARLDRLSRDAHFLLGLEQAGVEIRACDMPEANRLMFGVMALVAEHEAKMISERTKAALQAAKARGVKLGNPNGAAALRRAGKINAGSEGARRAANRHAQRVMPAIDDIRAAGNTSYGAIARELNAREIKTARGGAWHPMTVRNLVLRVQAGAG
jgi:DNA invertase Pin-like site-specific DNA recombinase